MATLNGIVRKHYLYTDGANQRDARTWRTAFKKLQMNRILKDMARARARLTLAMRLSLATRLLPLLDDSQL